MLQGHRYTTNETRYHPHPSRAVSIRASEKSHGHRLRCVRLDVAELANTRQASNPLGARQLRVQQYGMHNPCHPQNRDHCEKCKHH